MLYWKYLLTKDDNCDNTWAGPEFDIPGKTPSWRKLNVKERGPIKVHALPWWVVEGEQGTQIGHKSGCVNITD